MCDMSPHRRRKGYKKIFKELVSEVSKLMKTKKSTDPGNLMTPK